MSVDALHEIETDVCVDAVCARFVGAVGGVVSAVLHAPVDAVVVERVETFPAASKASTPRV